MAVQIAAISIIKAPFIQGMFLIVSYISFRFRVIFKFSKRYGLPCSDALLD